MYNNLSKTIENLITNDRKNGALNQYSTNDEKAIRRFCNKNDSATIVRSNFIRDIDKILNCPYYSRYQDKTQVFSLYKNDDITHRSLHVQYVSRIARTIGKALNLNTELIEAIALGHDIGHTPFGHVGEHILDEILYSKTKKHFYHNVQSVRVLDKLFPQNISLQTLDGILCHNGELELDEYKPIKTYSFNTFDKIIEYCYNDSSYVPKLIPCTLEGCIVRISDIIAYLGKDRQDAEITKTAKINDFSNTEIGQFNAEIINNITNNIIENSYNKPYIKIDKLYYEALKKAKQENYSKIYFNNKKIDKIESNIKQMMSILYEKLLYDLLNNNKKSYIFTHHIDYVNSKPYKREKEYEKEDANMIVVDYISSMTDDYFIDLFNKLFPSENILTYKGYFD